MVAEGKTIKAIAAARRVPPEAVAAEVDAVFVKLAQGVSAGSDSALRRLRQLHQAIVDREEQGETLSRLLPSGLAEKLRQERRDIGETERVVVTVLDERHPLVLDHRRARRPEPARRAAQHAPGGDEPGHPGPGGHRDAVRRRRGDGGLRRAVPAARPSRTARWRRRWPCTPCRRRSTAGGRPTACRRSGSAWGCRPARRRPRCSGRPSGWNTRWSETPSTCPSACSNWRTPERLCCLRPRSRRCAPQVAAAALGAQRVKGRDAPVYAYKINERLGE